MTTELKAKDFVLYFIKSEYVKRSKVINNLVSHVERLHKDFILSNIERTRNLKTINELIKLLNNIYKSRINTIKGIESDKEYNETIFDIDDDKITEKQQDKIKLEKITNLEKNLSDILKIQKENSGIKIDGNNKILETFYDLSFTIYQSELKKFCPNDFDIFDKKIFEIICSKEKDENKTTGIGCKNIFDIVSLFSKSSEKILESNDLNDTEKSLFDILNLTFIPLTVDSKTSDSKKSKKKINVSKEDNIPEKYDHLLGNYYKIELNMQTFVDKKSLFVYGFFEQDCVSSTIRSSQLTNKYVHEKRQYFTELSNGAIKSSKQTIKLNSIPLEFKEIFIQNMSVGELIGFDDVTFTNEVINDNSIYQKYFSGGNFKNVFSDFQMGSTLIKKFKIIKYLLLGSNSNNAGLLFSLTKEQKSGSPIIADLIYKNLSLPLQLKLHKENISIKTEIEKLSLMDTDDVDMKKQIMLNKNIPQKVKKLALEKLNEMKTGGSEYYKQLMYVKAVIDYPWIGENDSDMFTQFKNDKEKWREIMLDTKLKLDKKVYGHIECKETIVDLLAKWFTNPNSLGRSLGLHGPPGVGKTMIAMELGKSLGLPFAKINLAGMDDNSILLGHSSTYSGSNYGLIVKKMTETQAPRCILFFDELDKTATHHGRNEIFDVLIHVTDPSTNSQFNDKFFQDIQFPLNKVLFVFSFNNKEKIDPILLDRMEVIKVDPYSIEDKLHIVNNYLIKEIKSDIGMDDFNVKISDQNIVYIIETFTSEPGVRTIKRKLEKIFLKINSERICGTGVFNKSKQLIEPAEQTKQTKKNKTTKKSNKANNLQMENENKSEDVFEITRDIIDKYLGKPPVIDQKIHLAPEVGYVNGLYATDGGSGGLIPVIMYKNQLGKGGKFTFKITGNLKKVMTDSISLAFSISANFIKQKYLNHFFNKYPHGLHIHSGDLSIPKDGPSASSCYTLTFISKILNKKVKNNVGLTGECGGNGEVLAIGGLHYKLIGAKKAGIKLVFVPKENEKDVEKIKLNDKTLLSDDFRVMLVSNVKEILDYALIENSEEYDESMTFNKTFDHTKYLLESCINNSENNIQFESEDDCSDKKSYLSSEFTNNSNNSNNSDDSENEQDDNSSTYSDRSK